MNDNNLDVTESINNEIKTNSVVLYMKGSVAFPMCGFSAATVQVLTNLGVKLNIILVNFFSSINLLTMHIATDILRWINFNPFRLK